MNNITDNQQQKYNFQGMFDNVDNTKKIVTLMYSYNQKLEFYRTTIDMCCNSDVCSFDKLCEIIKYMIYLYKHNYSCIITTQDILGCDKSLQPFLQSFTTTNYISFNDITKKTHILYPRKNIKSNYISNNKCNHNTNIYIVNNNIICSSCISQVIYKPDYIFSIYKNKKNETINK